MTDRKRLLRSLGPLASQDEGDDASGCAARFVV